MVREYVPAVMPFYSFPDADVNESGPASAVVDEPLPEMPGSLALSTPFTWREHPLVCLCSTSLGAEPLETGFQMLLKNVSDEEEEVHSTRAVGRRCATMTVAESDPRHPLECSIHNTFVHVDVPNENDARSRKRAMSVPRSARLALPKDGTRVHEKSSPASLPSKYVLPTLSAPTLEEHQKRHLAETSNENELLAKDAEIYALRCMLRAAEAANAELKRRCSSSSCSSTASQGHSVSWADVSDSENEETEGMSMFEVTNDESSGQGHGDEQLAKNETAFWQQSSYGNGKQRYSPSGYQLRHSNWGANRRYQAGNWW